MPTFRITEIYIYNVLSPLLWQRRKKVLQKKFAPIKDCNPGGLGSLNNSASVTRDGVTVTLLTTTLTSQDANESGILLSALYNGEAAGSILLVVHNFENSSQYTFIPIFSTVLKQPETVNTSLSRTSSIAFLTSNGSTVNATPAAQFFPTGTYSSGWLGWAYSFNNYNTQG